MVCSSTRLAFSFSCSCPLAAPSSWLRTEISTRRLLAWTSSRAALSLAFSRATSIRRSSMAYSATILIGLDISDRHGHRRFKSACGEPHGTVPERRGQHERKQTCDQEAERRKHHRVDHRTMAPIRAHASPMTPRGAGFSQNCARRAPVPLPPPSFLSANLERIPGGLAGIFQVADIGAKPEVPVLNGWGEGRRGRGSGKVTPTPPTR